MALCLAVSFSTSYFSAKNPDKYEYPECGTKKFRIWFTDLKNNVVVPDAFVLKLLLIYDA